MTATCTTAGVDLAAEEDRTALARVEWTSGGARVLSVELGVSDAAIVDAVREADKTGIDCPFGWPDGFVALVSAHAAGAAPVPMSSGRSWRRSLALRATDLHVHARTGITPLSVSADRIAHAAMRMSAVLAMIEAAGMDADRGGAGAVAEVYPAAALRLWGLTHRSYKRATGLDVRSALVKDLRGAAPWLNFGPFAQACVDSDDVLDAVVCALVARAVLLGATEPAEDTTVAAREGWVHLPADPLSHLAR